MYSLLISVLKVTKLLVLVILTMIRGFDNGHAWNGFLIEFSNGMFGTDVSPNYRVVHSHNCLWKNFVWEGIGLWILRMWLGWNPTTIDLLTSFFRRPLISGSMNTRFSCATLNNHLMPVLVVQSSMFEVTLFPSLSRLEYVVLAPNSYQSLVPVHE